jgi:hypothetical protein
VATIFAFFSVMSKITPTQLLEWAVNNKNNECDEGTSNQQMDREKLDPKWLDVILGKPDSARIRELVDNIKTETNIESRISYLDELEMMVESMDNANDLQPLHVWPELFLLLSDEEAQVRKYAAWIIGTAVQNNEKAQNDFERNGGIKAILQCLEKEQDISVINKVIYATSSAIRANSKNRDMFIDNGGFMLLNHILKNGDQQLGTRCIFLYVSLLNEAETSEKPSILRRLADTGVLGYSLTMVQNQDVDIGFIEQTILLVGIFIRLEKEIRADSLDDWKQILSDFLDREELNDSKGAILDLLSILNK